MSKTTIALCTLLCRIAALGGLGAAPTTSLALVIDDFNTGPAASTPFAAGGPGIQQLHLTQQGLPTTSVLGGVRDLNFLHGGDASVGQAAGVLRLNYDQSYFEVANLSYSGGASVPPLNADLTAGGATHLLVRVKQATYPQAGGDLAYASIFFRSNEGEAGTALDGAAFPIVASTIPYTVAIPLQQAFDQNDLTDIDEINVLFSLEQRFLTFEFDEIATGTLLRGDLNADGFVNSLDYASFAGLYGAAGPFAADANGDGMVDAADYTVWRDALPGRRIVTPVPEPGGIGLLLLSLGAAYRRR